MIWESNNERRYGIPGKYLHVTNVIKLYKIVECFQDKLRFPKEILKRKERKRKRKANY